jgi:hypothetical protein
MRKPGKYYIIYVDENAIDSPGFETEAEADVFLRDNKDYLESNGEPYDSFRIEFVSDEDVENAREI